MKKRLDILLVENSIFDTLVVLKIMLDNNEITEDKFNYYLNYYEEDLNNLVNHVVICYTTPEIMKERIINSSISYSDVLFSDTLSTIYEPNMYFDTAKNLESLLTSSSMVDTSKLTIKESSLIVADKLLPVMRKEYVLKLKKYLKEKRDLK